MGPSFILPNFIAITWTVVEKRRHLIILKAAVSHLEFVWCMIGTTQKSSWWSLSSSKIRLKSTTQFWRYVSFNFTRARFKIKPYSWLFFDVLWGKNGENEKRFSQFYPSSDAKTWALHPVYPETFETKPQNRLYAVKITRE